MRDWSCSHASAGCNYPEEECRGFCVLNTLIKNSEKPIENNMNPDDQASTEFTQPVADVPDWIHYDHFSDVLTIHGKKYAASLFGVDGFLGRPGDLLRLEQSQNETVTLTRINADQPAEPVIEPSEDAKRTLANPPERIYLQAGDVDSDFPGEIHWRDVTWCDERVERNDLMYVRSDLAHPPADVVQCLVFALKCVQEKSSDEKSRRVAWDALTTWKDAGL